ncbi:MAG: alpha-galactosidase [Pirellulales bacterium]|nr:alpha-galactosidase [Pirellulales bacterium]
MQQAIFSTRAWALALLVILGAAPLVAVSQEEFEIHNTRVRISFDPDAGTWGMAAQDGSVRFSDAAVAVQLGGTSVKASEHCRRIARRQQGSDELGEFIRLEVSHAGLPHLAELVWSATLRPSSAYAVLRVSARIAPDAPGPLQSIQVAEVSGKPSLRFGKEPAEWTRFSDSGGQGGTGVSPFFTGEKAGHASPATLVVHDAGARQSLLVGWLSWSGSNPALRLAGSKQEGLQEISARCSYFIRDSVSEAAAEPLLIGFEPDPLASLDEYAQEVRLANHPPIRKDTVLGWLSWYCSRLQMTEQFVLDNAKVISDRFRGYGVDTMQVDHGWEYRDIVGHWVANDRFPHGMKWLGQELEKLNVKLGIWMAASRVSEFAPFYAEHPGALIRKPDGSPWVFIERWTWAPHGRVFNLDPTHPDAQRHYRQSLQGLMDAGCRYYKVDFIGSAGVTDGLFHDPRRPRGNPLVRYEMQQIRDAIGPDSWLRYCSSPTNVYCGIVNIGGATMDIGNASGSWDHLEKYHQQLGSCWYKHRTFWHNEPDALIVGEGPENEARLRCAWLVLSGGVVALGDNLPKVAPERMAMVPKCLPPYDVAARPLDLFEHVPSRVWDLRVRTPWDDYHVLGLFNFQEREAEIAVPLDRLGLAASRLVGWEFWTQSPVDPGSKPFSVKVPGRDCRILVLRTAADRPQVLATDMHLTMGGVELPEVKWDAATGTLSGLARRAPGEKGTIFLQVPPAYEVIEGGAKQADCVVSVPLTFQDCEAAWTVRFKKGPANE